MIAYEAGETVALLHVVILCDFLTSYKKKKTDKKKSVCTVTLPEYLYRVISSVLKGLLTSLLQALLLLEMVFLSLVYCNTLLDVSECCA